MCFCLGESSLFRSIILSGCMVSDMSTHNEEGCLFRSEVSFQVVWFLTQVQITLIVYFFKEHVSCVFFLYEKNVHITGFLLERAPTATALPLLLFHVLVHGKKNKHVQMQGHGKF
jgi:hypothetical protein